MFDWLMSLPEFWRQVIFLSSIYIPILLMMGLPWLRQGKEYRSGQLIREDIKTKLK